MNIIIMCQHESHYGTQMKDSNKLGKLQCKKNLPPLMGYNDGFNSPPRANTHVQTEIRP